MTEVDTARSDTDDIYVLLLYISKLRMPLLSQAITQATTGTVGQYNACGICTMVPQETMQS